MNSLAVALAVFVPLVFLPYEPALQPAHSGGITLTSVPDDNEGWLGVSIQDMTARLAKSMETDTKEGALVNNVVEDSPAEKAGIMDEDIITSFDGKAVSDADDLVNLVGSTKPDTKVSVVLMRGKEQKSLEVTLGTTPHHHSFEIASPHIAFHGSLMDGCSTLGMELEDLPDQLGEYFGAPANEGVLVSEVREETPAAKTGFKAGDVILKVGNQTIREVDDVMDEVEEYKKGDRVGFEILRDKTRKTLTMEIEEESSMFWFRSPRSEREYDFDMDNNFNFEFDADQWREMEKDIRQELDRARPELENLRIHLRELRQDILDRQEELRERMKRGSVAVES